MADENVLQEAEDCHGVGGFQREVSDLGVDRRPEGLNGKITLSLWMMKTRKAQKKIGSKRIAQ